MSRNFNFQLSFTAIDSASSKISQISKVSERASKAIANQNKRTASDSIKANEQINKSVLATAQVSQQTAQRVRSINGRMIQDRERLGIRSEERIRREIQVTELAYKRLVQTGRLSAQEQARAYDAMRSKVAGLKKELQGVAQQQSLLSKGANIAKGVAAVGSGVMAASYMLAQPVNRTMDYEKRLTYMAITAYDGEGKEAKKAGSEKLRAAVNKAAQYGGSKDDAADALNELIASGAVQKETAMNILPELQKVALANNASTIDVAKIAIAAMQNYKVEEKDLPQLFDIAAKSASLGSFEMADLAKWLPKLMAASAKAGMSGIDDFKVLAMAAQTAKFTASSGDEAGNNLQNLLLKINSPDTEAKARKIQIAPGKSIDLTGTLAKARENGVNQLDAFVGIVEQVVSQDKRYQALRKKMAGADTKSPEYKQMLESMASLLQGSAIGQIASDQQQLMALVAYMNAGEFKKTARKELDNAAGTNDENYSVIADTAANKTEKLANAKENAEYEAFKSLSDTVGDVSLKLAEYANQYPGVTSALVGASEAIKGLMAAAGAAGVVLALMGGKGGLAKTLQKFIGAGGIAASAAGSKTLAKAATTGVNAKMTGGRTLARTGGKAAGIAGGALLAADAGMQVYSIYNNNELTNKEKNDAYIDIAKDTAITGVGMWAGAKAGAGIGGVAGPYGAAIGSLVGAILGPTILNEVQERIESFFDEKVSEKTKKGIGERVDSGEARIGQEDILRVMDSYQKQQSLDPQTIQVLAQSVQSAVEQARQTPQKLDVVVDVQNGNIAASVNQTNSLEARRY